MAGMLSGLPVCPQSHLLSHKRFEVVSSCKLDVNLCTIFDPAAHPRAPSVHICFQKHLRDMPDTVAMTCRSPTGLPARAPHQASLLKAPMPAPATAQQQPAGLHWPLQLGFQSREKRPCPARWRASCSSAAQRFAASQLSSLFLASLTISACPSPHKAACDESCHYFLALQESHCKSGCKALYIMLRRQA